MEINTTALVPLVHLNGDSKQTLVDSWTKFMLDIAKIEMPEVHGRNYYPKGDDAPAEAIDARMELKKALTQIHDVAMTVAIQTAKQ